MLLLLDFLWCRDTWVVQWAEHPTLESRVIKNYSCSSSGQCFRVILSLDLPMGLAELEFSLCPVLPSVLLVSVMPQSLPQWNSYMQISISESAFQGSGKQHHLHRNMKLERSRQGIFLISSDESFPLHRWVFSMGSKKWTTKFYVKTPSWLYVLYVCTFTG